MTKNSEETSKTPFYLNNKSINKESNKRKNKTFSQKQISRLLSFKNSMNSEHETLFEIDNNLRFTNDLISTMKEKQKVKILSYYELKTNDKKQMAKANLILNALFGNEKGNKYYENLVKTKKIKINKEEKKQNKTNDSKTPNNNIKIGEIFTENAYKKKRSVSFSQKNRNLLEKFYKTNHFNEKLDESKVNYKYNMIYNYVTPKIHNEKSDYFKN